MKIRQGSIVIVLSLLTVLSGSVSHASERSAHYYFGKTFESTPTDLLKSAAFFGNPREITALLAKGVDVNGRDEDGYTPLIWAQLGDRSKAVKLLLDNGADINGQDRAGYTALHQAALAGRERIMKILLARGANVETVSRNGRTALMDAADRGRSAAVKLLLAYGADPKRATERGRTAATMAEQSGHRDVAMLLGGNGADPDAPAKRVMETRDPTPSASGKATAVCPAGPSRDREVLRSARDDRPIPEQRGAQEMLREALETWDDIQAKYPDAEQRLRQFSQKGVPPDKLSQVAPLLTRAREVWQRLQREHPALAAQLLNLAGISR